MNTKQLFAVFTLLVLCAVPAFADMELMHKDNKKAQDSATRLCREHGFDFAVGLHVRVGKDFVLIKQLDGYDTNAEGSASHVEWTATPGVAGVIAAEGIKLSDTFAYEGGTEGSFNQKTEKKDGIIAVVFCGEHQEVPEFSTVLLGVTIAGALAGLVAFRKQ